MFQMHAGIPNQELIMPKLPGKSTRHRQLCHAMVSSSEDQIIRPNVYQPVKDRRRHVDVSLITFNVNIFNTEGTTQDLDRARVNYIVNPVIQNLSS